MEHRIYREPQIPTAGRYETVAAVRAILLSLEQGQFYGATRLIRQMWQNPRLRVAMHTRLAGLTGAEVRWRAAVENRDGRAAKRAAEEDWPLIISTATRKQLERWGLMLGVGLAQRNWYESPSSGREIPRVQVYDPAWASWSWTNERYVIQTRDKGQVEVESPAIVSHDLDGEWIIHEPFGSNSWREGYAISAWYAWLGNNLASRDRLRASEKVGEGNLIAELPHGADKVAATAFRDGLKAMKGGAVIPCEEMEDGRKFNVRPLEWSSGNGYQVVAETVVATNADLVILLLGQDWSTQNKGGGSYAAVQGGLEVSAGYVKDDAAGEGEMLHRQVMRPWAEANFGDPDLAPIREVVTDPPVKDKAEAEIIKLVADSVQSLRQNAPEVDIEAILERLRIPRVPAGSRVTVPVAVAAVPPPTDGAADPAPVDGAAATESPTVTKADLDITAQDATSITFNCVSNDCRTSGVSAVAAAARSMSTRLP